MSNTTRIHASIVKHGLSEGAESCIVTPTAKPENLDILASEVLLSKTGEDRDSVFVLSSDTGVRENFRELAPPSERSDEPLCEREMPVANVTADGKLSQVTESPIGETHPRFLFSYTSKRIPIDDVGERVACVIFDDSVKFTEERLNELREWRDRNGVPTIAYLTSDPLSDLYESVSKEAITWTWPVELLEAAVQADERRSHDVTILGDQDLDPTATGRVGQQLRNRTRGVAVEVNVPGGERIEELFEEVHRLTFDFERLAREMDVDKLWAARQTLRFTTREFEELLTPIGLAEIHSRRSISTRLSQLDRFSSRIGSDPEASPAAGTYRDAVSAFERLREEWPDVPESEKKEGQLAAHLISVNDRDESVAVVTPDQNSAQAVASHLQSEYSSLYEELGSDLQIHDSSTIRTAGATDNVLLYGAPRYDQRDLLRLAIAPRMVILSYPSELRLLQSQVKSLNEAFEAATELQGWQLVESATEVVCGEDATPRFEQLDVDVPDVEERTTSDLVGGTEIRDEGEAADLADIVRTFDPDYLSPTEDPIDAESDVSNYESSSYTTTCTVFKVKTGGELYYRPTDEVSILLAEHEKVLSKEASSVSPPEIVLHFEDTGGMRETLYSLIRERGDAELAFYASSWRVFLEQAIDDHGDDLNEFIQRVEEQLDEDDYKVTQTYRSWYNLEVRRTRSKESMLAIAKAYDLTFVIENLQSVWDAIHEMESLYQRLKEALKDHALRAATTGEYEDVVVSENPRVQLSDFDINRHLHRLEVSSVERREDVPSHKIGSYVE